MAFVLIALDRGVQEVGSADEVHYERIVGAKVDVLRRASFNYYASTHYCDVVRNRQGLNLVMSDIDGGDSKFGKEVPELLACALTELRVEVA